MALFRNFDPAKIIIVWNGIQVLGVAKGVFVKVSREVDTFTADVGAGGDVVRVRSRNRKGVATITLQSSSPTNDLLSAAAANDELTGLVYGPLLIKDLGGTTLAQSANSWIRKPADVEYGADHSDREWNIDCAELEMVVGGSVS